jgi:hypothetical protein
MRRSRGLGDVYKRQILDMMFLVTLKKENGGMLVRMLVEKYTTTIFLN